MKNVKKMILGTAILVIALIFLVLGLAVGWLGVIAFVVLLIVGILLCVDGYLSHDD